MKFRNLIALSICLISLGLLLQSEAPKASAAHPTSSITAAASIGNPAAAYCRDLMGYDYSIITDEEGGQTGLCAMPDRQTCDQWDFYAGTCGADFSYCAQQGLTLEAKSDGQDPYAPSYSVCTDPTSRESFPISSVINLNAACSLPQDTLAPDETLSDEAASAHEADLTDAVPQAPSSFDWRSVSGSNWVTSVKNQSSCGSCWSFATVGTIEASWNILTNNPGLDYNLSEQHLVSPCSSNGSCGDCGGGSSSCSLLAAVNYGIPDEACFPYNATDSSCSGRCSNWANRVVKAKNRVYGFGSLTQTRLKEYISRHGPVTVYMGINSEFGGYWDGDIYRCRDDSSINHAVLAVGYNSSGGYWIIKNSWGSSWHSNGYFKVGFGECAIDTYHYSFIDIVKPISSRSISGTIGDNGWYTSNISVSLTATDSYGSGVDYIQYHLNSASWVNDNGSSASATISTNGNHTFYYRAVDNGGNIESTHSFTVKRDAPAPSNPTSATETACGAANGISQVTCDNPNFSWNAGTDSTSGIAGYYVYFGANPSGTSSTYTTSTSYNPSAVSEGIYYLRLRTKDNAGNLSGWQTRFTFVYQSEKSIYIPMIAQGGGSGTETVINNPGFESGQDGSWTESSTNGWDLIYNEAASMVDSHSGSYHAWLGGDDNEVSLLSQSISIKAGDAVLHYWYWITSYESYDDPYGNDYAYVQINGSTWKTHILNSDNNTGGWVQGSIDLSNYAGQTVTLLFRVSTDNSLLSNFFLDDVSFAATRQVEDPVLLPGVDAVLPKSE